MVDVRPFRGLRYNSEHIGDLSAVISPPYDVISPEEQSFYYQRSPFNIVRLEAALECPEDAPGNDKYTRAATTLRKWLGEGILLQEERPAFYVLLHRFVHESTEMRRWSLLGRVRLEDWREGVICPHEVTMQEPARDRLALLRSCKANISPIMALVPHGMGELLETLPRLALHGCNAQVTDNYGVTHCLWVITDEKTNTALTALFAETVLYIADGHHRYETALAYRDERRAARSQNSGEEGFNFIMMDLVDAEDPSVVVLPTHRVVRCPLNPGDMAGLKRGLASLFEMERLPASSSSPSEMLKGWLDALRERRQEGTTLGLYGLEGKEFWLLTLREKADLGPYMPPGRFLAWKELDVGILHSVILQGILGMSDPDRERSCVDYTRDALEALSGVNSGEYQLAFFLNPVPVSNIIAISNAGERMPQKSTYFYPKPPAGLVIHPLWD